MRSELQQLSTAGLLTSEKEGRQVQYRADRSHPLFPELQSMVRKALGMDRIVDSIIERLGKLEAAYLTGDYAEGRDTGVIDLVLVGDIDRHSLSDLVEKTERYHHAKNPRLGSLRKGIRAHGRHGCAPAQAGTVACDQPVRLQWRCA